MPNFYVNFILWIMKIQSKQLPYYYHNQLYTFYRGILLYNFIVRSYDKIQHVILLDLDLNFGGMLGLEWFAT